MSDFKEQLSPKDLPMLWPSLTFAGPDETVPDGESPIEHDSDGGTVEVDLIPDPFDTPKL